MRGNLEAPAAVVMGHGIPAHGVVSFFRRGQHGGGGFVALCRFLCSRYPIQRSINAAGHRFQPLRLVQVVEVGCPFGTIRAEVRDSQQPAHRLRGFLGLGDARIAIGAVIVIRAQDQPQVREFLPQCIGRRLQVARVESHCHRVARRLMDACAGSEALGNAQHPIRLADAEVTAANAPAGQVAFPAIRSDELQRVQHSRRVTDRQYKAFPVHPCAIGGNALAGQVVMAVAGIGFRPQQAGPLPCFRFALGFFGFTLPPGRLDLRPVRRFLGWGQGAPHVRPPVLPAQPIAPVLEAPGGEAVQVQQIGRIALAAPAFRVAAMNDAIGQQVSRGNDAAPGQRIPELLEGVRHAAALHVESAIPPQLPAACAAGPAIRLPP